MVTDVQHLSASSLPRVEGGFAPPSLQPDAVGVAPVAPSVIVSLGAVRAAALVYNADGQVEAAMVTATNASAPPSTPAVPPSAASAGEIAGASVDPSPVPGAAATANPFAETTGPFIPGAPGSTDILVPELGIGADPELAPVVADNEAFFLPGAPATEDIAVSVPPVASAPGTDQADGFVPGTGDSGEAVVTSAADAELVRLAADANPGSAGADAEAPAAPVAGANPAASDDVVADVDAARGEATGRADATGRPTANERPDSALAGVSPPSTSSDDDLLAEIQMAREFAPVAPLPPTAATTVAVAADDTVPLTLASAPPTIAPPAATDDALAAVVPVASPVQLATSPPPVDSAAAAPLTPAVLDAANLAHDNISGNPFYAGLAATMYVNAMVFRLQQSSSADLAQALETVEPISAISAVAPVSFEHNGPAEDERDRGSVDQRDVAYTAGSRGPLAARFGPAAPGLA